MIRYYRVKPCPAPRQTRRDKYKPSPPVVRYRAFRDEVAAMQITIPQPFAHVVFVLPMAPSWSKKKKLAHVYGPHLLKPDKDNLEKALLDAVYRFSDDAHIWNAHETKVWGWEGAIFVSDTALPVTDRSYLERLVRRAERTHTAALRGGGLLG